MKWHPRYLRFVTVVASFAVMATIVLANLSFDKSFAGHFITKSYGWPLIWHRYVLIIGGTGTVGWYYSPGRLAANVAMWLFLLLASAGAVEWLSRRYRVRLRFSVRTMLACVALAAACCAWFVRARQRADAQDPLFEQRHRIRTRVERSGPKWIDLLGVDRYRRRIVSVKMDTSLFESYEKDATLFDSVGRLSGLRQFTLEGARPIPALADALRRLPRLRNVNIDLWNGATHGEQPRDWNACLAAIAKMRRLESLSIYGMTFSREMSECLSGLPNLKSLELISHGMNGERVPPECLTHLGKMTQLEWLSLNYVTFPPGDMNELAGLTSLKSLNVVHGGIGDSLHGDDVPRELFVVIGKLRRLEHFRLAGGKIDAESLACLANLSKLKTLNLVHVETSNPPLLGNLPVLPNVIAVGLWHSQAGDGDLEYLAALPHLKALGLADTSVTHAGLASLSRLESLEDVAIEGEMVTPAGLEALMAIKGLTSLRLGEFTGTGLLVKLPLDDGRIVYVPEDQIGEYTAAIRKLRRAKPGIVIKDGALGIMPFYERPTDSDWQKERFNYFDSLPDRKATWLPKSDAPWMTQAERAKFESEGGWARFDAAGWKGKTFVFSSAPPDEE